MTATVAVVACILLSGCGRTVGIVPPTPDSDAQRACSALAAGLPSTLAGTPRRPVSPDSPYTAAWGDPPIELRCGVPRPAALQPDSTVVDVNGVSWFPQETPAGSVFTSVGTSAYVEVVVPASYDPAGTALVGLSSAISAIRFPA